MKNSTRFTATLLCMLALIASPTIADAQKEKAPAKPAPVVHQNNYERAAHPASPTTTKSTATTYQNPTTEKRSTQRIPKDDPRDPRVLSNKDTYNKDGQLVNAGTNVSTGNNSQSTHTTFQTGNVCKNEASRQHLYLNFWSKYGVSRSGLARRQMRHCGCRGDVIFMNPTNDTLDVFFQYVGQRSVPTIDNTVLPPLANQLLIPNLYILPNDSIILTGSCMGGLNYEAVSRKPLYPNEVRRNHGNRTYYANPTFFSRGIVIMQCMSKRITLVNEVH